MISIQSAMLVGLGFLAASLFGLLVASAFWSRAVRLTTARIKQSMPVSEPEIRADRDRLRAEYAIKVHKLEMLLEQAKLARARQHIEINRRDASISTLETDVGQLKADLEEHQNARRVLEQTVADRLPRVEARLAEAKRLLFNRDREIAELAAGSKRHKQALEEASSIAAQQSAQIQRLTSATTRSVRARAGTEVTGAAARAELDALRDKTREQARLIDRLQRRLGSGYGLPAPAGSIAASPAQAAIDRAHKELAEAEAALLPAPASPTPAELEASRLAYEREIRELRARGDDQTGEIARLKSALATFEQGGNKSGGLRESKIGLKARLGAAQAQTDQQSATIGKLRAELAATHERLARQAAHFMEEMRRFGTGGTPNPRHPRRPLRGAERLILADRDAPVALLAPGEATAGAGAAALERSKPEEAPAEGPPAGVNNGKGPSEADSEGAAAAEMPKEPRIPGERRRSRLLDRITGLGKS